MHDYRETLREVIKTKDAAALQDFMGVIVKSHEAQQPRYESDKWSILDVLESSEAVFLASAIGREDMLKILLGYGLSGSNTKDRQPLYVAADKGFPQIVAMLLKAGFDCDMPYHHRMTALYRASSEGHVSVVDVLLGAGASINKGNSNNHTPICAASAHNQVQVVERLIRAGALKQGTPYAGDLGVECLKVASSNGHREVVKQLLDAGVDVNKKPYFDRVLPIVVAARRGHEALVIELLAAGADATVEEKGNTVSQIATAAGHVRIASAIDAHLKLKEAIAIIQGSPEAHDNVANLLTESFIKSPLILSNFVHALCHHQIKNPFNNTQWDAFLKNIYLLKAPPAQLRDIFFELGCELYGQDNSFSVLFLQLCERHNHEAESIFADAYKKLLNISSEQLYWGHKPITVAELEDQLWKKEPRRVPMAEIKLNLLEMLLLDSTCFDDHMNFVEQYLESRFGEKASALSQPEIAELNVFVADLLREKGLHFDKPELLHQSHELLTRAGEHIDVELSRWKTLKALYTPSDQTMPVPLFTPVTRDDLVVSYASLEESKAEEESENPRTRSASM